jgi:hypothetical protein
VDGAIALHALELAGEAVVARELIEDGMGG